MNIGFETEAHRCHGILNRFPSHAKGPRNFHNVRGVRDGLIQIVATGFERPENTRPMIPGCILASAREIGDNQPPCGIEGVQIG